MSTGSNLTCFGLPSPSHKMHSAEVKLTKPALIKASEAFERVTESNESSKRKYK